MVTTNQRAGWKAGIAVAGVLTITACSSPFGSRVETAVDDLTTVPDDTTNTESEGPDESPAPDSTSDTVPDTTGSTPDGGVPEAVEWEPGEIAWDEYSDSVELGVLDVPIDYSNPDGGSIEIFLARFKAQNPAERIGTLFVNPGGPGFGGSDYAIFAPQVFDAAIIERFDIIGWDPRGTGESEPPIDCIDDYDPYFTALDSTPEDEAEYQELLEASRGFVEACVENNGDIIGHVGTNNSARDIDAIRRALGENEVTYFGFSYGSELGGTWATLFPETVRAAVLDGASDPNADPLESSLQQMRGFQQSVERFLAQCSATTSCPFHNDGDAEGAYLELLEDLDANPLPVSSDRPPVNRDVAIGAVIQAMYSDSLWPALAESLAAAQKLFDGSGLLSLYDQYYQRRPDGSYGNELEAFQTISCADTDERPTPEETDAEAELFHEAAPLLVPEESKGGYFCNFYPPTADPRVDVTGAGAGPIVVIGTTFDPATPFESTRKMAETLEDGRLVIVDADQHTGYGLNQCVIDVVNDYLIDLNPPEHETECT